jgi:hypothetical protein
VDDIKTAMTEAKKAAGEKDVLVHGAAVAQLALAENDGLNWPHCTVAVGPSEAIALTRDILGLLGTAWGRMLAQDTFRAAGR